MIFAIVFLMLQALIPSEIYIAISARIRVAIYIFACSLPSMYLLTSSSSQYIIRKGKSRLSPMSSDYILLLAAFLIFLAFIMFSIDSIDLQSLVLFSEKYRNSFYKGSGIFTIPLVYLSSLFILIDIYTSYSLIKSKRFWLAFIALLTSSLLLGLRVILFSILLHLVVRFNPSRKSSIIAIATLLTTGLILSALYKVYLGLPVGIETLIDPFTRLKLPELYSMLSSSDSFTLPLLHLIIPLNDTENLKREIFSDVNKHILFQAFPRLSKYSGIATPASVYFLTFGPLLSVVFFCAYCLVAAKVTILRIQKRIFLKVFQIISVSVFVMGLTEDYPNTFAYAMCLLFAFAIYLGSRLNIFKLV